MEWTSGYAGYGISRVVGAKFKPSCNPVGSRDVPTPDVTDGTDGPVTDHLVVHKAALFGIDPQFPHDVFAVELVGPVGS